MDLAELYLDHAVPPLQRRTFLRNDANPGT